MKKQFKFAKFKLQSSLCMFLFIGKTQKGKLNSRDTTKSGFTDGDHR